VAVQSFLVRDGAAVALVPLRRQDAETAVVETVAPVAAAVVDVAVVVAAVETDATAAAACQTVQLAELAAAGTAGMTVARHLLHPMLAACHRRQQAGAVSAQDCLTIKAFKGARRKSVSMCDCNTQVTKRHDTCISGSFILPCSGFHRSLDACKDWLSWRAAVSIAAGGWL
jgi:hypothetical protein